MAIPEEEAERLPILGKTDKKSLLAGQQPETEVFARRWYVISIFSLASFTQALIWNTWGPITESSEAVFDWNDGNIGMLANYGNIGFMITVLPMCYLMDSKGLRVSMIGCTFLIVVGAGIRCITIDPVGATWTANICSVLVGIGGSVPFAGPALVSSVWFPPDQRATATAGVSFANYFGVAIGFILGPQMVHSPAYSNHTVSHNNSLEALMVIDVASSTSNHSRNEVTNMDTLKTDIRRLMYSHAGLAALLFILVIIYFPAKPPLPPSKTASIKRTNYIKGLRKILGNGPLWLIVLAYAIPAGVLGVWVSVLDVNLKPLGISQTTAGYMGFWQTLAGCIAGLFIARFSDIFMKRMKVFLIVLYIGAVGSSAWFTILCEKYIPFNIDSLYAACILIGVCVNGAVPLFYEISCEASYPVAEGVTGGFLTLSNNLFGVCFLFILLIKNIGRSWMNWALLGSTAIALPMLFLFPERYRRTDLDITIDIAPATDIQASQVDSMEKKHNPEV